MELQCKERVNLLVALKQSRDDAKECNEKPTDDAGRLRKTPVLGTAEVDGSQSYPPDWISQKSISAMDYHDLSKLSLPPPLPSRPSILPKNGSQVSVERSQSSPQITTIGSTIPFEPPPLPILLKQPSRTPSPEKRSRMLTTLRGTKDGKKPSKSPRTSGGRRSGPPAASKAAGLAWDSVSRVSGQKLGQSLMAQNSSTTTLESMHRDSFGDSATSRRGSIKPNGEDLNSRSNGFLRQPSVPDLTSSQDSMRPNIHHAGQEDFKQQNRNEISELQSQTAAGLISLRPPTPPPYPRVMKDVVLTKARPKSPVRPRAQADFLSYRNEYPPTPPSAKLTAQYVARKQNRANENISTLPLRQRSPENKAELSNTSRRPIANISTPRASMQNTNSSAKPASSDSGDDNPSNSRQVKSDHRPASHKPSQSPVPSNQSTPSLNPPDRDLSEVPLSLMALNDRIEYIREHLPKGVDENAAKQIFNEIVIQGDEVHWDDVAGLDAAKTALKEAVVYPFLRPDLFMGLREPARGMLLFGPPGTGKTMLARAVATESRSTFFAISASSLTSKWLGESEKLVRALFSLAKALAPSIIFVDEIDSLLSSRGGSSEHESTRRIKTEFLIQWSDLQRAAAGKAQTDKEKQVGDASRVLVLAATNLPWAIDEAARRRFVRRQYIPLPEGPVRATQLRTLLGHQKHSLNKKDIQVLVELTDGMYTKLHSSVMAIDLYILRLLRFGHHRISQGCSDGSSTKPWGGVTSDVYG